MAKENKKKPKPKNLKTNKSEQISAKAKDAPKAKKKTTQAGAKKRKIKLSEHTAFKNKDKKKKKDSLPVWVKKSTLHYEEELHKLQIELLKLQKHVKKQGLRLLEFIHRSFSGISVIRSAIRRSIPPSGYISRNRLPVIGFEM